MAWREGKPGSFARFVAILPVGNYTLEELATAVQAAVTTARGSTALIVRPSNGLQFQYITGFVLKIPTAAELANAVWKSANWDSPIVPVGEVNDATLD